MNTLQEQIDLKSKEIHTDSYPISIGEIISMYKDGDIDIHPEFQRFFRWTSLQKTMLIESILLNIPIPPIFVAQRKDGIWDIVDGLQRMSTILQFTGVLQDEQKNTLEPLKLEGTKILPALKDKRFGDEEGYEQNEQTFTEIQRRYLKRAKLNFIIIQKESDDSSKYELFQRLNTGGTSLTPQEVRSCLMVMNNHEIFSNIKKLSVLEPFIQCTRLSDKNIEEQYNIELVIRFICLRNIPIEEVSNLSDLSDFLNIRIIENMDNRAFNWDLEYDIFRKTFEKLASSSRENSFERYNKETQKFSGGFLVSAYEMVALGVGCDPDKVTNEEITEKIKQVWQKVTDDDISWKGYNASGRLVKTLKVGRAIFQDEAI